MSAALETKNLSKSFLLPNGQLMPVFTDLSLKFRAGSVTCIVGPSGCGKTTFLRVVAGLLSPDKGVVLINGSMQPIRPCPLGFMFQTDRLLPWRTALENVLLGVEVMKLGLSRYRASAFNLLETFGLAGFENVYPNELSEGMRQRVAFARTLLIEPKILLLDEPFSNVDYEIKLQLEAALLRAVTEQNITVVNVTHDLEEAIVLGEEILVLSKRPTHVVTSYSVDVPLARRNPLLMRQSSIFAARLGQLGQRVLTQE